MRNLIPIALLLVACSSQKPAESADDAAPVEDGVAVQRPSNVPNGPPSECVDDQGEPIECEDNTECCEGFECGYDPEGSNRIKTCIWAGG